MRLDAGVAVYFYFGFLTHGLADPVDVFSRVEALARDTILACGRFFNTTHHTTILLTTTTTTTT
jgi:hypothetical protein